MEFEHYGTILIKYFALLVILAAGVSSTHERVRNERSSQEDDKYRVVCYYPNWAQHRKPPYSYRLDQLEPSLCTHVIYAFATIHHNNLELLDSSDIGDIRQLHVMRGNHPRMKTLWSVGGGGVSTSIFHQVANDTSRRKQFAQNVLEPLRIYGFDGLDVDWEFPEENEKQMFSDLLKDLRESFDEEAKTTWHDRLLLTAAMSAGWQLIDTVYDIPSIAQHVDFINVMAYDLHGFWEPITGLHAALKPGYRGDKLNLEYAANRYVVNGVPRNKVVLGLATYGHSYTLCDSRDNGVGDPQCGLGTAGTYTNTNGTLAYYEICSTTKWTQKWDSSQQSPYAYSGKQWVGYENARSARMKGEYMIKESLGGVMFWDLSMDDFLGQCGEGTYPIVKGAKSAWMKAVTSTREPDTSSSRSVYAPCYCFSCTGNGLLAIALLLITAHGKLV